MTDNWRCCNLFGKKTHGKMFEGKTKLRSVTNNQKEQATCLGIVINGNSKICDSCRRELKRKYEVSQRPNIFIFVMDCKLHYYNIFKITFLQETLPKDVASESSNQEHDVREQLLSPVLEIERKECEADINNVLQRLGTSPIVQKHVF